MGVGGSSSITLTEDLTTQRNSRVESFARKNKSKQLSICRKHLISRPVGIDGKSGERAWTKLPGQQLQAVSYTRMHGSIMREAIFFGGNHVVVVRALGLFGRRTPDRSVFRRNENDFFFISLVAGGSMIDSSGIFIFDSNTMIPYLNGIVVLLHVYGTVLSKSTHTQP